VTDIIDEVNGSDTASEDEYADTGLINDCADKRDHLKINAPVVIGRNTIRGYVNGENIGIVRSLLRKGRGIIVCIFQWGGGTV